MTDNEKNYITITPITLIKSNLTQKVYMSEDRCAFAYENKQDTLSFLQKNPETSTFDQNILKINDLRNLYSQGIQAIKCFKSGTSEPKTVNLEITDFGAQYYNPDTNCSVLLAKQTRKKKYLRKLVDAEMFVPTYIEKRFVKCYPSIHYCYGKYEEADKYYVLFTTLQEFKKWNDSQETEWSALRITISNLHSIQSKKNEPVIINPLSDKLILRSDLLKEMLKKH